MSVILGARIALSLLVGIAAALPATAAGLPTGHAAEPRPAPRQAMAAAIPLAAAAHRPFGLREDQAGFDALRERWRQVSRAIAGESDVLAGCLAQPDACASEPAGRLAAVIAAARERTGRARLGEVNRAINLAIRPASDMVQHGLADVWSAPLATLTAGRGDCEDYAIAKYVALRHAGLAAEDLRLMIVHDGVARELHAVVAARLDGRWLVLDNRGHVLLEDREFGRYEPVLALGEPGGPATDFQAADAGQPAGIAVAALP